VLVICRLDGRLHDREGFDCGEPSLNLYLHTLATQHLRTGIAATHVLADDKAPSCIFGYYSMSAAQMSLDELSVSDRRRLPRYPVPAARLARLAVSVQKQGHGLGEALLQDAVTRCLSLREELGIHALLVDALNERAAGFYRQYGFRNCATSAMTLYLPLGRG